MKKYSQKRKGGSSSKKKTQRMNCNPAIKGKTISKNTCYTKEILNKIRDEYNKGHSETERIHAEDPTEIWNTLKTRLTNCSQEDCWLEEIKDTKLKRDIDKHIFAPDAPPEWKKNPTEWLTNFDILAILKQYEEAYPDFAFFGPSPIDFDTKIKTHETSRFECVEKTICHFSLNAQQEKKKTKIGFIFNLDDHSQPGSHWISLFVDMQNHVIFYFDSAGNAIPEEILALKNRIVKKGKRMVPAIPFKYYDNFRNDHQQGNTECGMYSLFFIITMLTLTINDAPVSLKDAIRLFRKGNITDQHMEKYRKIYFNQPSTSSTSSTSSSEYK